MRKAVILLPAWNEKGSIGKFIDQVFEEEQNAKGWSFEILVVVDKRSKDGTLDLVENMARGNRKIHVIQTDPGLGTALIEGHRYSIVHLNPDALAQLDADGQVKADVLPRLLGALDKVMIWRRARVLFREVKIYLVPLGSFLPKGLR